eukprot:gene14950-biopygen1092
MTDQGSGSPNAVLPHASGPLLVAAPGGVASPAGPPRAAEATASADDGAHAGRSVRTLPTSAQAVAHLVFLGGRSDVSPNGVVRNSVAAHAGLAPLSEHGRHTRGALIQ